ncbi:piggyBac transposable element-derived protein 4-like [Denticeps clupeoides]|uniref:piggyBac transposable element-derived protein 4-like n=1 Tax=Denticeps clupeoides TaxID=299321 RepID=UPI0010A2F8B6|nr:piggyBac transposable element-derived protein 4-like [Denticeps clupeoides]
MDQMIAMYSCRRKTRRWPLVVFFNMLDISALNAYIVWTAIDPTWNVRKSCRRRLFLDQLGKMLVMPERVGDIPDAFDLFLNEEMTQVITRYTNLHGRRTVQGWKDLDATTIRAYFGLLLLAGVYRSRGEATRSLWGGETGRHIFRVTMPRKTFEIISRSLYFDDRLSRPRRRDDKLAAIRDMWDQWTDRLPQIFNPGADICVDEQLVAYRGRCNFRQYMPKKPGRYGVKIWATCDVVTSYVWRVSVYTGRSARAPP